MGVLHRVRMSKVCRGAKPWSVHSWFTTRDLGFEWWFSIATTPVSHRLVGWDHPVPMVQSQKESTPAGPSVGIKNDQNPWDPGEISLTNMDISIFMWKNHGKNIIICFDNLIHHESIPRYSNPIKTTWTISMFDHFCRLEPAHYSSDLNLILNPGGVLKWNYPFQSSIFLRDVPWDPIHCWDPL